MTTDLSLGLGTTSQTSFFMIDSYSLFIASFQTWCFTTSSNVQGSDCTMVLMAAKYPWYLFDFLLSRNVPLGAICFPASSRVSLSHEGLFLQVVGSLGGGSMGSIDPSTSGIGSSNGGSSCFHASSSSLSFLGIGRSCTFLRAESSSKVTSQLISTSL